ncbi:MAG: hypothetical protein ACXADS_14235 [Candidatus Thorarchaeota archaeon]
MPLEEHSSERKTREFTRLPGYYLLSTSETALALMSVFFVGFYTFHNPLGSDWVPGLENLNVARMYLALSVVGFASIVALTANENKRVKAEGSIHVSLARAVILFSPPFAAILGPLGVLLTLITNGTTFVLDMFLLYGFALGFIMGKTVSILIGLRRWRVTQVESDTKEGYYRDVIVSRK